MRLPEFAHATAFHWTLAVAAAFVMCTLLLFGFVYWQTASYMTSTVDGLLTDELRLLAADTPEQRLEEIDERLRHDPRRIRIAGLFGADAHRIAGNLESCRPALYRTCRPTLRSFGSIFTAARCRTCVSLSIRCRTAKFS